MGLEQGSLGPIARTTSSSLGNLWNGMERCSLPQGHCGPRGHTRLWDVPSLRPWLGTAHSPVSSLGLL